MIMYDRQEKQDKCNTSIILKEHINAHRKKKTKWRNSEVVIIDSGWSQTTASQRGRWEAANVAAGWVTGISGLALLLI